MINKLCILTTYFNPQHYKSRFKNYQIFKKNLIDPNLITIECAFNNDEFELENSIKLRSASVLWQKERMLNYALALLPEECEYIAWIDGDVIFGDDTWIDQAIEKFENGTDIIQLFDIVEHLPPNETQIGQSIMTEKSFVWQAKTYPNFLELRNKCKLLYATTGFAYCGRKKLFTKNGFYDKHVLGANDNIIIDCCLNSFGLHHYYKAGQGTLLLEDMMQWAKEFGNPIADYLPITIHHLFHGKKQNRGYLTREDILKKHNFNPKIDIILKNNLYEWNCDNEELKEAVKNYFASRLEDSNDF